MKRFVLVSLICIAANTLFAQYGFAYASNTSTKILYISRLIKLADYRDCKDLESDREVSVNECLYDAYLKSIKIEAGSSYLGFLIKAVTSKSGSNSYNGTDAYESETEGNNAIKDIIAEYRGKDYTVKRIDP